MTDVKGILAMISILSGAVISAIVGTYLILKFDYKTIPLGLLYYAITIYLIYAVYVTIIDLHNKG